MTPFDFEPLSDDVLALVAEHGVELYLSRQDYDEYTVEWTDAIVDAQCGVDPMPTIRRAFVELRATRAALREWDTALLAWDAVKYAGTAQEQQAATRLTEAEANLRQLLAHIDTDRSGGQA